MPPLLANWPDPEKIVPDRNESHPEPPPADTVCAHNIKFDRGVIEAAIARHYGRVLPLRKPLFCTMEAATPVVNLPPTERMRAAGFNKPKPPKLEECIRHFFNEDLDGAHDAMIDVAACRRVYFHLKTLEA